jgi:GTP-binding protein
VVSKALKQGLRPIVAINKIDRPDERHDAVLNEIFDLFANLDATDEQLDFPVLYGSGRDGWMATDPKGPENRSAAAVRPRAEARAAADGRGRPVPHAGHHVGG